LDAAVAAVREVAAEAAAAAAGAGAAVAGGSGGSSGGAAAMNQLQQQWQAAALSFGLQPMATLPSAINSLAAAGGASMSASFLPYTMQLAVAAMAGANQGMTAAQDAAAAAVASDGAGLAGPGSSQWGLLSSEQPSRDEMGGHGGSVGDAQVRMRITCYLFVCIFKCKYGFLTSVVGWTMAFSAIPCVEKGCLRVVCCTVHGCAARILIRHCSTWPWLSCAVCHCCVGQDVQRCHSPQLWTGTVRGCQGMHGAELVLLRHKTCYPACLAAVLAVLGGMHLCAG
jgi:hypothetical protein